MDARHSTPNSRRSSCLCPAQFFAMDGISSTPVLVPPIATPIDPHVSAIACLCGPLGRFTHANICASAAARSIGRRARIAHREYSGSSSVLCWISVCGEIRGRDWSNALIVASSSCAASSAADPFVLWVREDDGSCPTVSDSSAFGSAEFSLRILSAARSTCRTVAAASSARDLHRSHSNPASSRALRSTASASFNRSISDIFSDKVVSTPFKFASHSSISRSDSSRSSRRSLNAVGSSVSAALARRSTRRRASPRAGSPPRGDQSSRHCPAVASCLRASAAARYPRRMRY